MEPTQSGLDDAWLRAFMAEHTEAHRVLMDVVRSHQAALAQRFYDTMMQDTQAAVFLSAQVVQDRLKPGMQQWLCAVLCSADLPAIQRVMAAQRHVGAVHARGDIPVFLVARGFRVIKQALFERLQASGLAPSALMACTLYANRLIDMAFEEMSEAFVHSHDSDVRVDEAFRLFSTGQNLALEREKQVSALLGWENSVYRFLSVSPQLDALTPLGQSAFGLWLQHKAPLIFDRTPEIELLMQKVRGVDQSLLAQSVLAAGTAPGFQEWTRGLHATVDQIRYLLQTLFDRLTDLEVGRDALTQLFNRRFLHTILRREIELHRETGHPFSVLMVDVDHFKRINDEHGHEAGDRVLQSLALMLLNKVRASDFVIRYGGEEFLVVLADADAQRAQAVAEKVRQHVERTPVPLSGEKSLTVTISVGLAAFDDHPDYQHLINRADQALYAAKAQGRNRCAVAARSRQRRPHAARGKRRARAQPKRTTPMNFNPIDGTKSTSRRTLLACWAATLLTPGLTLAQPAAPMFKLGIAPHTSARVILEMYQPLRLHLEKALGQPVEVVTAPNFTEFARRMLQQEYDLAVTTGHQARLAETDARYTPLLTYKADFRAVGLVAGHRKINKPADLRNKAVLGLSPTSLVTLWGRHWMDANGLSQPMRYVSASDSLAHLVLEERAELAFTSLANYQSLPREVQSQLRFLVISEPMAGRVYVLNSRHSARRTAIVQALDGFAQTEAGQAYFARYKLDGYRALKPGELQAMDPYAAEVRQSLKP